MATSGSISTNKYTTSSSGTIGLVLSWSRKSYDLVNNTTTLNWTLKSNGTMSSGYYVQGGPITATINGTKVVNTTSRVSVHGGGGYKKTGTITIKHNEDGTKSVAMSVKAALYSASVNCTASKTFTLDKLNRYALLGTVDSFTNETYPTITYSNPAGTTLTTDLSVRIKWTDTNNTEQSTAWHSLADDGSDSPYTFDSTTITSNDFNKMLQACPNSNTLNVTYELQSTMNGTVYTHTKTATMTVVNKNPVILSGVLSYQDTDSVTVGRTGNNQIIVQNKSILQIHVDTSKVQSQAYSTIASYTLDYNSTYTPDSSGNVTIINPNFVGIYPAILTVTDSRGNTNSSSINITIHELTPPSAIYTLKRKDNYYADTTIYVDGKISSVAGTNTLTIKTRFKEVGSQSWSAEETVPNKTTYHINSSQGGLDNTKEYDVQVIVYDKYYTSDDQTVVYHKTVYNDVIGKGAPIAFFDRFRHSVGVNGLPDADEQLYVDGTLKIYNAATDTGVTYPHRYSETEHVVGYWVDGSPIYEKTVFLPSAITISSGGNTVISTSIWNQHGIAIDIVLYTQHSGTNYYAWRWVTAGIGLSTGALTIYNGRAATLQFDAFTIQYVKL